MKLNNKGFTLVEGLLIVIALSLVVGVGYYVVNANENKQSGSTDTQSSQQKAESKIQENRFTDQNNKYSFVMPDKWTAKYVDYGRGGVGRVGVYPEQYLELTSSEFAAINGNPSIARIETFKIDGSAMDDKNKPITNLEQLIAHRKYQFGEEDAKAVKLSINGATVWQLEQNTKDISATGPPELNGGYRDVYYFYSKNGTDIVQLDMRVKQNASINYQGTKILDAFDNSKYFQGFDQLAKSLKVN